MNELPDSSAVPPATASAPAPAHPPARAPVSGLALLAFALAILAAGVATWSWLDNRERTRDLKVELGRQLAESGQMANETRLLAKNADDATRQLVERVGRIEGQIAMSQQQQLALEALYKELAQGRDAWALAEIEQVLLSAAQQLQMTGNVRAAIIALEGADTRLQRLDKPQFTALRRAVATDLANLRAAPALDEVGASARIEALVARHAQWPLVSAQVAETAPAPRAVSVAHLGQELWDELKRLVQIRRIEGNEAVLLPPDQAYFLRENLRLRLLSARLALIARDEAAYHADLRAARDTLSRYFNVRDAGVAAALKEIHRLDSLDITIKLPGLDASLAALETYKGAN